MDGAPTPGPVTHPLADRSVGANLSLALGRDTSLTIGTHALIIVGQSLFGCKVDLA